MLGATAPARIVGLDSWLPVQDGNTIAVMAERFDRASMAQAPWARIAKECVDFFEGRQWTAADLRAMAQEKRPTVVLNMIKPVVNLVLGIFSQNRTDIKYMPSVDDTGSDAIAEILNKIGKSIDAYSQSRYVDGEWFMDGLFTGRGCVRTLLDQRRNYYGEVRDEALDPFSWFPDPDGQDYDSNKWGFQFYSRWLSLDDVRKTYPPEAFDFLRNWIGAGAFQAISPSSYYYGDTNVRPPTRFGGDVVGPDSISGGIGYDRFWNYYDPQQKTIRLLECEHHVAVPLRHFVDVETGDMEPIPDDWDRERIVYAMERAMAVGNPWRITTQMRDKVRWTQMMGDLIVYDEWSLYENFSITGYFPYFRRGMTQGMIEPLLDPQRELNKRNASRLNILMRMVNSGMIIERNTVDQATKEALQQQGSKPGQQIYYDSKNGTLPAPKQLDPPVAPEEFKRLQMESETAIMKISGINESAMGQLDVAQSGRAIESRQRQAIVGVEPYLVNYQRTKTLIGQRRLEIVQRYYREPRVMRIIGDDGKPQTFQINVHQAAVGTIVNDITVGKYEVVVDTTPLSASFLEAQFNEAMLLREKGVPIPDDILMELSSLGRKPLMQQRIQAVRAQMGLGNTDIPAAAAGAMAPTAGPGGSPAPSQGGVQGGGGPPSAPAPPPQAPPPGQQHALQPTAQGAPTANAGP